MTKPAMGRKKGTVRVRMETSVNATRPPCSHPRVRKDNIVVAANKVLIFHGSRYAHGVTASENCVRVIGWVCEAGKRVIDDTGGVQVQE